VSCLGSEISNIEYNSLLNLNFRKHTNAITFAVYLILVIRGKTVVEADNYTNTELSKTTAWTKDYNIEFNEEKSTAMIVPRRKRKK